MLNILKMLDIFNISNLLVLLVEITTIRYLIVKTAKIDDKKRPCF